MGLLHIDHSLIQVNEVLPLVMNYVFFHHLFLAFLVSVIHQKRSKTNFFGFYSILLMILGTSHQTLVFLNVLINVFLSLCLYFNLLKILLSSILLPSMLAMTLNYHQVIFNKYSNLLIS